MPLLTKVAALGIAVATGLAAEAAAKVAPTTLEEIVAGAELIALVEDVENYEIEGWRIARADVALLLKGRADGVVLYLAAGTWTCDTSTSEPGSRALVFLHRVEGERAPIREFGRIQPSIGRLPVHRIAHSGRGRIPVFERGARTLVEIWVGDVRLPAHVRTESGRDPEFDAFIRSVPLEDFLDLVREIVREDETSD